jgi:O-antigen ligase
LQATDEAGRYGISEWSRGRDTRAAGFFGHYTTYAEAIQLILSVAFALLIVVPGSLFTRNRIILAAVVVAFCGALFLTVTRASWAGFLVSAAVMILIGTSKKTVLICLACAVPIALAGTFYLQQQRNVAFFDTKDGSTTWRMTVWREGFGVLVSNPRHLAVGIGMDSIKTHWQDWRMFDNGNLPMGHMHSTPLQMAFERGVPTLVAWLAWMFFYLRILWRSFRRNDLVWPERGVLLGCLGGTSGFLAGGLVHYNWGDSEVVMIFYLLMGLSLAINRRLVES